MTPVITVQGRGLRCIAAVLIALAAALPAVAQTPPVDKHTTHTLHLPSHTLEIAADVGTMRLVNPAGAVQAEVVTTAFSLAGANAARRPVTFAINGGPGASSAWLDLGAIGPWRVPFGPGPVIPSRAPVASDNAETWLDFTDLVFIDPPGTGYSRIIATGDEVRRSLYSVDGDIETLAVVARRWLEAHGRLQSPKFIVGESYGGFRGPKLARTLLDRQGIGVSGLVLISPVLDFNGRDSPWDVMREVVRLPTLVAAARAASGRAELRDAEDYATGDFLLDLVRGQSDLAATERLVARVIALTGVDSALVRRRAGRLDNGTVLREREAGHVASPYDLTVGTTDPFPAWPWSHAPDPLLDGMRGPVTSAILDLYANRLGWKPEGAPERQYELLNAGLAGQWDYGRRNSRPESFLDLREFLALDPASRVLVAHGLFDLVTPYFATKLLLDQAPPTNPPGRLSLTVYGGGHMFYSRDVSRAALHDDAAALVAAALAARP